MPKKNFYLSEDDLKFYEKAKELAGASLSSILVQCLKDYVRDKEIQQQDMQPLIIFRGEEDVDFNEVVGEKIKFVGKLISTDTDDNKPDHNFVYYLYLTRKNNFLLHIVDTNTLDSKIKYDYKIYKNLNDLYGAGLTNKLIADAERIYGAKANIPCKELDI